jgi:hypothetical protein
VFKVMTWNVENLFRVGESGPTTSAAYDTKLKGLAKAINEQAPDALAVQEIGDRAALDDLVALLNGVWQRQASTHPDGRGIRVACICARFRSTTTAAPWRGWGRGAVAITVDGDSGQAVRLIPRS